MKKSERLERQIERIHRVLEAGDAVVTWNDHIPDPDNEAQRRQIDVTIRRGSLFTIIECRLHADPQDVTWIEELMGRRESLRADAVIAVSASGFTSGAISKADAKGIILRTLETLTDEEVRNWGREVNVSVTTYRFIECSFKVILSERPSQRPVMSTPEGDQLNLMPLFGAVMDKMEEEETAHGTLEVGLDIEAGILISGVKPIKSTFFATIERSRKELRLASVVAYSTAGAPTPSTYAIVRHFDLEAIEIVDAAAELGVVLDLSGANLAPNEYVRSAVFDFGQVREAKWFYIVGVDEMTYAGQVALHLRYPQESIE